MNEYERIPTAASSFEGLSRGEASFDDVSRRIEQLVLALNEALDVYRRITMPDGREIEATNEHEEALAKAQMLRVGIEGVLEQHATANDRYGEEAAALSVEALKHVEGLLAVRADLMNRTARNPAALRLARELDLVIQALLPTITPTNDETYHAQQAA